MVALKNSVCRLRGSSETMRSTSGMKPMSSMRSASSITSSLASVSRIPPRSNMSISRPGRGDQHVDAAHQHVLLIGHALAADDQRVVELQVLAVLHEVLGDLQREFARRLQDQAARHAGAGARAGQDVQHRQGEAGGLAGAGLRRAQHVAAHQHDRNRLLLDRRRMPIAHLGDGAQHRLGQPEIGECRARSSSRIGSIISICACSVVSAVAVVVSFKSDPVAGSCWRHVSARTRGEPRVTRGVSGLNP